MKGPLLIIGGTGTLGRHLVAEARRLGLATEATRRTGGDGLRAFSLADDAPGDFIDRLPQRPSAAFVCAAESGIDRCRTDPASARINVDATQALFSALAERGILTVFYSSDLVFSGTPGEAENGYREDDACRPGTAYGQQKWQAEQALRQLGERHLIIRLSKLYSGDATDTSPLTQWQRALAAGQSIPAAIDQWITPTWAGDVAGISLRCLAESVHGTLHVAAPQSFTRHALAVFLATQWGYDPARVIPCRIGDFAFAEPRPQDNRLNTDRLQSLFAHHFRTVLGGKPAPILARQQELQ